jgi:hypothetical protein
MAFSIFLIVFSGVMLLRAFRQYRKKAVSRHWLMLMMVLWLGVMIVAISPQSTDRIAAAAGVGRGADLLVYTAIVTLLASVMRMQARIEMQRRELTTLVRKLAIKEGQSK